MNNQKYRYENGGFVIEDFDREAPFCSFLPGLTGADGVPIWSFYCNRGQGICSFGIENKDNAIMEFFPANAAYQHVGMHGFRTYIYYGNSRYEPFSAGGKGKRLMKIFPNSLCISEETDDILFEVTYFILPRENFPAMVRRCRLTNKTGRREIKILDGMPQIMPYGVTTGAYKSMSNLQKSWATVSNLENNMPYYHLLTEPGDDAEVKALNGAYFYLSFSEDSKAIRPVTDPELIFGQDVSFTLPENFPVFENNTAPAEQVYVNKFSCAVTPLYFELDNGESAGWNSLVGFTGAPMLFAQRTKSLCSTAWLDVKEKEAETAASEITGAIGTKTAVPLLDGYFRQCYMDNVLRGGVPFVLGDKIIHLFSRKHGDPERDYNFFSIAAEYFSQGNGNFRDVCQNRRNDVLFCPEAGEFNINTFFSLIQADGFNPLEVRGSTFTVKSGNGEKLNGLLNTAENPEPLRKLCSAPFTAGAVINTIYRENVKLPEGRNDIEFLTEILSLCEQNIEAVYGEGYWSDHWTYLTDLVDSYLSVFPDKKNELFFGKRNCRFFDSPVKILPRREAYVYKNNTVMQINSTQRVKGKPEKDWIKTKSGETYTVSLFEKMVCISAIKLASLDPLGCGIEMNGGRPGWNDAMNGLPGLLGSGMSESLELLKMVKLMQSANGYGYVKIPLETAELLEETAALQSVEDDYVRWDRACLAAEKYRGDIINGFDGDEVEISEERLNEILRIFEQRLEKGRETAEKLGNGLMPTYLTFEAVRLDENNFPLEFKCKMLPAFLEGPVREMKTIKDTAKLKSIYDKIRNSELFDKPLGMYRTSVNLDECGYSIGRIRSFSPGWLERESIFMHMEFKYLLEMLKGGLYDEFYSDIKTALPPFIDPRVYGRSTMENSSFIASSNNPDKRVVGRGFVSRLSGSTAEVLSMWRLMFMGENVFKLEDGELCFGLEPKLSGDLFDEKGTVSFTLLGKTPVTYHNPERKNTYGGNGASVKSVTVTGSDGREHVFKDGKVKGSVANMIRSGDVKSVYAELR